MAILTNNLLFNHTYLKDLTADTSIDPVIPFAPRDLGDWYNARNSSSTQTLVASWVQPLLSLLELEIHAIGSGDEHIFELTTAYDHDTAIGICYVTPPGADLDTTTKGRFWMAQAVLAARRHEPTLRWVILTNGDLWRLLDAQALRRYEAYVQIDVGQLARGASDPSALRVFFRCFFRTAFVQDGNGKTGIEKLLEASDHATEKAERHLKERVSGTDGIMAQLCLGLVRSTGKSKFTDEEREAIYRDATTLLYRMLFLLYAESRSLLPIENPSYAAVSILHLMEAAKEGQQRGLDQPQATRLWSSLKRLSNAIYESDPNLDIPAYNGGLFDDDDHPYLRDGFIADQFLSRALFDLAFLQNGSDIRSIDYRDLSVRHLGSLYEGMIEYKLFVAEQPMLARRDTMGNIHFLTQKEGGGLRRNDQEIKIGDVYFAQSSGERRATGTYYTPEHIVDYIVHCTVIRGLEERRGSLEEKLKTWLGEIITADPEERSRLQRTVDEELQTFVEEKVLTFTVCDPAMGSGHFLVNAAHHMANFISETVCLANWINDEIDIDISYWRRRVAERCLYGVDISEMAVELAKLSLWLATMSHGKPLSFLEHHLKRGNSLVGSRLESFTSILENTLPNAISHKEKKLLDAGQLSMMRDPTFSKHFSFATSLLDQITTRVARTVEDIKYQEDYYDQARLELSIYYQLADFITGRFFGVSIEEETLRRLMKSLANGDAIAVSQYTAHIQEAQTISANMLFFHWDLEYPEIFVNLRDSEDSPGFDSVIGNPPYDVLAERERQENLSKTIDYFGNTPFYAPALGRKVDIYRLFMCLGVTIAKQGGLVGFITPMSVLADQQTINLREFLVYKNSYINIDAFPQKDDPNRRIFYEAKLATCISIFRKGRFESKTIALRVHPGNELDGVYGEVLINQESLELCQAKLGCIPLTTNEEEFNLLLKLHTMPEFRTIGDYLTTFQGEINETTHNKYLSENPLTGPKVFRGGNVQRYEFIQQAKQGRVLYLDEQKFQETYNSGKYHHSQVRRFGYQRKAALDNWRRLIFCELPTPVYCFESISYYLHEGNTSYYLLALLNSRLLEWRFRITSTNNMVSTKEISYLPIWQINVISSPETIEECLTKFQELYSEYLRNTNQEKILDFITSLLSGNHEHADLVRDILAILAEQMITSNKEKQVGIKAFLEWLENQLGTSVNNLTGKTYLLNFLGDYQKNGPHLALDELAGILVKNKHRLAVDPDERGFQRALEKRYQESLDLLLPIKKRLAMTDQLIDQIVYRLYGLTEEEIRIVEGN